MSSSGGGVDVGASLPPWATLVRAHNPGPMTLDGTNTWLLHTGDGFVVVDPGPLDELHLRRAAAVGPVVLTLLTHGHPDHAEGVDRFVALTGAPVRAADPALCVEAEPLQVGRLELGDLTIDVLPTPGHTGDSVCFAVATAGAPPEAVLTGDTILGRGTTVVAHPDGRLADYLSSLVRLRSLGQLTVLPGHGPVLEDVGAVATAYLTHRNSRLAQVRAAVDAGASTAHAVVERVYADVDRSVWPAAELSVRAQLEYLGVPAT